MTTWIRAAFSSRSPSRRAAGSERTARSAAPSASEVHGIDRDGMDTSVAPGDDFFRYANGAWEKKTRIPPDRSSYGTVARLIDRAQQRSVSSRGERF
jgi:putative endopeptidase